MNDCTAIRIEKIISGDQLKILAQLAAKIFPQTYGELLSRDQILYMMDMMYAMPVLQREFAEGIHFALILDENTPIGYISWHDQLSGGKKLVKLEKLYVDFAYHHRGIGNLALRWMIETAKASDASALLLNVNKDNVLAQKAYLRAGFVRFREEKNPIGCGFFMDDYVMRHDLGAPSSDKQQEAGDVSKFGKSAVLKGMNLLEGATAKERNEQIGGHKK